MGDIAEEIAEFLDPDSHREIRPGLRLIPFAMSGGGDLYCFHLNTSTDAGVPVVYMYHDVDEATFQAKNLQDFMFRSLLEAVVEVDADSLIVVGDFAENCQAVLDTHGPFLSARQRDVVADIYRRELRTWVRQLPRGRATTYQGLLSDEELAQILGTEISFEQLDQSFTYMLED